jgi:hypothetical protein
VARRAPGRQGLGSASQFVVLQKLLPSPIFWQPPRDDPWLPSILQRPQQPPLDLDSSLHRKIHQLKVPHLGDEAHGLAPIHPPVAHPTLVVQLSQPADIPPWRHGSLFFAVGDAQLLYATPCHLVCTVAAFVAHHRDHYHLYLQMQNPSFLPPQAQEETKCHTL